MTDIGIIFLWILQIVPTTRTKFCIGGIFCTTFSARDGTASQSRSTICTKFRARHIFVPAFGTLHCLYIFCSQDFIPYLLKFQNISKSFRLKILLNIFNIINYPIIRTIREIFYHEQFKARFFRILRNLDDFRFFEIFRH